MTFLTTFLKSSLELLVGLKPKHLKNNTVEYFCFTARILKFSR